MSDEAFVLTRAGYEELKLELDDLLAKAPEMRELMSDVRDEEELASQDPTFFDAMTRRNQYDERVMRLQQILSRAVVIDEDPDPNTASPGDRVTVRDEASGETLTFDLLGSAEIAHGRRGVSIESPVGSALLNKKIGATVEVDVPDGKARYTILELGEIPADEETTS